MQKPGRLYENNAPEYLRTHPVTAERIADAQNRIQGLPYKQTPDSLDFQLVRARLRAGQGTARDARLYKLQAKGYASLGKRLLQHQAQAEAYLLQGSLPAAIEQLQLAQKSGDGDFYQLSVVEARLRALQAQLA